MVPECDFLSISQAYCLYSNYQTVLKIVMNSLYFIHGRVRLRKKYGKAPLHLALVFSWYLLSAQAQFKEIGPALFSPAIGHQKIKQLLVSVNPANRKPTVRTLAGWVGTETFWIRTA